MPGLSDSEKATEKALLAQSGKNGLNYTPPSLDPTFEKRCIEVREAMDKSYKKIVVKAAASAVGAAGVTPRIRISTLADYCEKFAIPIRQKFEGLWGDHVNDSGGPTMRGVITVTFQGYYKKLFIDWPRAAGESATAALSEKLIKDYPDILTGGGRGDKVKGALYTILSSHQCGALFIWAFLCEPSAGYPIVVMSAEPWLGYLQFMECWGGGSGAVFGPGKAAYDVIAKNSFGRPTLGATGWPKWICNTLDPARLPELAVACFAGQVGFYDRISRPGNKNNQFRKGWFNGLINNPTSNLKMAIITNEVFNKNGKGWFEFDAAEKEYLGTKAKIWESMTITYPTGG